MGDIAPATARNADFGQGGFGGLQQGDASFGMGLSAGDRPKKSGSPAANNDNF